MDANGTRYHLVQGWPDWRRFTVGGLAAGGGATVTQLCDPSQEDADVVWDCASSTVMLRPEVFRFLTAPGDRPPSLDDRRGAGCDLYGNWYWIAPNGREVLVQSSGSGAASHYWSAEDELARQHELRYGDFGPAEAPAAITPLDLRGLAVTEDAYLVVGVVGRSGSSSGLLVFDLFAGGPPGGRVLPPNGAPYVADNAAMSPPEWLALPAAFEFTPFDMAPRPGGGVFVLDRAHRRVWLFDRRLNLEACDRGPGEPPSVGTLEAGGPEDFQPVGSATPVVRPAVTVPAGLSLDAAIPLGLVDPVAIEGLGDGSFLVLDRDPAATESQIYHIVRGSQVGQALATGLMRRHIAGEPGERLLWGHDIAFMPAAEPVDLSGSQNLTGLTVGSSEDLVLRGTLAVASGEGNQVFEFQVYERAGSPGELLYEPLPLYLPMRLFGGKALVACGGRVYYDFDDRWLPLIEQRRPRHILEATLISPAAREDAVLDGKAPDCIWHRLFIDACLPPGAAIRVQSRAANELPALARAPWQVEPALYRRPDGPELPYTRLETGYDTYELLFQAAQGQFLQLALTLQGTGQVTPRVRSVRAYYGRFSYAVHYLPAVYREQSDAGRSNGSGPANDQDRSLTFIDRFMAQFEGFFTGLEDKVAAAQALLDPRSAPAEVLDWLGSWFGIAFDPHWDNLRRRLFIRYAMTFFAQRGTLNGLLMALQLGFGRCINDSLFTMPLAEREAKSSIRIIEQFRTRRTPSVVLGDPTEAEGLRLVTVDTTARWRPKQGGAQLQERYTAFLQQGGLGDVLPARFRPIPPGTTERSSQASNAWSQFCLDALGFVPVFDAVRSQPEVQLWQDFLARRYGSIETLNNRYRLGRADRYAAFVDIPLLSELPADGAALFDWYAFYSVVAPMHRAAHHFVVLLPAPANGANAPDAVAGQLDLARRVVDMEKPAHTTFSIRFYWAMFRVGEARLGLDTLIEHGGRSPQFMQPLVLGQGHLAESFLTASLHDDTMHARRRSVQ